MLNAKIIKASRNKDGKVVITLFGQEYDVSKKVKDGIARLNIYGTDYEIRIAEKKKAKTVIPIKSNKVDFIETEIQRS